VLVVPHVLVPIGKVVDAASVLDTCVEEALVAITVRVVVHSLAFELILLEGTLVALAIGPREHTSSRAPVVLEIALIAATTLPGKEASTVATIVPVLAFVSFAQSPRKDASLPMLAAALEFALIAIAIGEDEHASSMKLALFEGALVAFPICKHQSTATVGHRIPLLALVRSDF
jgi:hypothetical protein